LIQVWLSYTALWGAAQHSQLSLGDLGSQFKIQGTPSLPQLTVSGYFTLAQSISGPEAGTNFYSVRNVFSWNKGSHTFKSAVSYRSTGYPANAAQQLRDLLIHRYQGEIQQRAVRFSTRPADYDEPGCPGVGPR